MKVMVEEKPPSNVNSISRFILDDEKHLSDESVNSEVRRAFREMRAYQFYLKKDVVEKLTGGESVELYGELFFDIYRSIIDSLAAGDSIMRDRFGSDNRLSSRLVSAITLIHLAASHINSDNLLDRRFVIIKELPGKPTITHHTDQSMVLAHVGAGPDWSETPTIYFGLKTLDAIEAYRKRNDLSLFLSFIKLLEIEERAIETGYIHDAVYSQEISQALSKLLDTIVSFSKRLEIEEDHGEHSLKVAPFTGKNRNQILKELNAREKNNPLNFKYDQTIKAVKSLEKYARKYKRSTDILSLHEVMRLLVAASGHDIHEVRDMANILLERLLAPKEFDAPLASTFINQSRGEELFFTFELEDLKGSYLLRIYRNGGNDLLVLEKDIEVVDLPLEYNGETGKWETSYTFDELGHYDFAVMHKKVKKTSWLTGNELNGRINVIPDMRGEVILEIFPDIHGHTRLYWQDPRGHSGMVYNENGEIIRLGTFTDIAAHLEDIKKRYLPTALYLLGVQKRGHNREDWTPQATSPSPFSPMSLVDIEPFLGGDEEFKKLVARAHELDIKIIVDIIPHINRGSDHLPEDMVVKTYGHDGRLYPRASTDGRYGSWDDGMLLNYRKFEIWQWMAESVLYLIDTFDIDGIRFDSAHAVPIMMKKNNYPFVHHEERSLDDMVEGTIIDNNREYDHFVTTGYYDSACRDIIAVPFHFYLMQRIEQKIREKKKNYFVNIAECYWGHERFLTRTGLIPYNSSLFKICENIIHGKSDVREIYHIYDNYFPNVLPRGTELLGIQGNHDERRALNTFGHRGLRAAVTLTSFMSNVIMDYEGSAEGEGWKVFLDNIYVNWNQFEFAAHRSLEGFYHDTYQFHRDTPGKGYLVWANNTRVAAALKFSHEKVWLGAFNFSDNSQNISVQFDNPALPLKDDDAFKLSDPLYSTITHGESFYTGKELKISRINTVVSYTDRVKLLKLERVSLNDYRSSFLTDSFLRLAYMSNTGEITSSFAFEELTKHCSSYSELRDFILISFVDPLWDENRGGLELALKRAAYYLFRHGFLTEKIIREFLRSISDEKDERIRLLGDMLRESNRPGSLIFMSAEAEPFSKSGGLANVVFELPRELVKLKEKAYVITGYYRGGDEKSIKKFHHALEKYNIAYTGKNITIKIHGTDYSIGVHYGDVDGIGYYLLDHYEFFDGLYWGYRSDEKLRKRVAFARACAEVILTFDLQPRYTFTNDAFAGVFNGIVRSDEYYIQNEIFKRNTFLHIIHNGGWQYFDAYNRWEGEYDLFSIFNLPVWRAIDFTDPHHYDRLNCMATGIRFSDRVITVSPTYAKQIEFASDGLEGILNNVIGISNAIGSDFKENIEQRFVESRFVEEWETRLLEYLNGNRTSKRKVEELYPEIFKGYASVMKIHNGHRRKIVQRVFRKLMLQHARGLEVNPHKILFTMIHRISEQKGFQLLLESSEGVINNLDYQFIIGGAIASGDRRGEEIAHGLYLLSKYYPSQVNVNFGFQDVSVPLLATDIFGMPSMHEPGGISQLEAFTAGALVVARATGGLRDTILPVRVMDDSVEGNGFLFTDYNADAFYDAMERASWFMKNHSLEVIQKVRDNAQSTVYYWDRPARQYAEAINDITETIKIIHSGD